MWEALIPLTSPCTIFDKKEYKDMVLVQLGFVGWSKCNQTAYLWKGEVMPFLGTTMAMKGA